MRLSRAGVVRSAALCWLLTVVLAFVLTAAGLPIFLDVVELRAAALLVVALFLLVFVISGFPGGRAAAAAGLRPRDAAFTAGLGCGIAYVVILAIGLSVTVVLGGPPVARWQLLAVVVPFLASGAAGGWLAGRSARV